MARPGRKRKFTHRTPSGHISRAGQAARIEPVEAIVLAQPHRQGSTDQRLATPFGRFCVRQHLGREIYDAGERFASVMRQWRAAKGIKNPWANMTSCGSGEGPSDQRVRVLSRRMASMERTMMSASLTGFYAVRQLVLDGDGLPMDQEGPAIVALLALTAALGLAPANP